MAFLESPDQEGVPRPTSRSLEFLVHEIAHSYVNPVFNARVAEMRASAEPLFRRVEAAMRREAYPTYPIMVNESVVRAVTGLFLRERVSAQEAARSLGEQTGLGFTWVGALAGALDAERKRSGGRLSADALVRITQRVLATAQR